MIFFSQWKHVCDFRVRQIIVIPYEILFLKLRCWIILEVIYIRPLNDAVRRIFQIALNHVLNLMSEASLGKGPFVSVQRTFKPCRISEWLFRTVSVQKHNFFSNCICHQQKPMIAIYIRRHENYLLTNLQPIQPTQHKSVLLTFWKISYVSHQKLDDKNIELRNWGVIHFFQDTAKCINNWIGEPSKVETTTILKWGSDTLQSSHLILF